MTAQRYRDALLKHWRLTILLALAAGLGALLASQVMTHRYRSAALVQIVVNPAVADPAPILGGDTAINAEIQLATSPGVLASVTKGYPGLSVSQLSSEIAVTNYRNANLMQISVTDASPTRAASLANGIATVVIAKQEQIREQQNALYLKPLQDKLNTIESEIESATATLATLPNSPSNAGAEAKLHARITNLNQQKSAQQTTISRIQSKQALIGFTLQLAQQASPNSTPVRPLVWANVLAGVIFGVIAGMLIVLGWEWLSLRAPASEDVIASFGWPFLATLGTSRLSPEGRIVAGEEANEVLGDTDPCQQIITALRQWDIEKPIRSLTISGLGAEESAQYLGAQLAIQIAASGERTLLVNANVEHSFLDSRFGIKRQPGLNDAVIAFRTRSHSEQAITAVLQSPTTLAAPNLRIVSAGGPWPNPMRVFRSSAMTRLMEALCMSGAQRVLYSAPPLFQSGAAQTLARRTDGILLVIDPGQIRRDKIQRVYAMFTHAGIRVLGYVLAHQLVQPDQHVARVGAAPVTASGELSGIPHRIS